MSKFFNQIFFLRKSKCQKGEESTIYLRITFGGKRTEISMQRHCDSKKWSSEAGRVMGKTEEIRTINKYLEAVEFRIYEIYKDLVVGKKSIDVQSIRAIFLGITEEKPVEKRILLVEVYKTHNKQVAELVGKDFAIGTLKKFRTALTSLESFIKSKFNVPDISVKEVNYQFITDYEFYLKTVQGLQHNTAMGILKKLKKIIRQCVANEWLSRDPFTNYKIRTQETNRDFLLEDELSTLSSKMITNLRLAQVRDIFVFSCYIGLSFSDVEKLSSENIVIGIDGEKWVAINRTKTQEESPVPLLPVPLAILNKYENHPKVVNKGTLLPILTNQRMNTYLKELAAICGINKELTFHCARHTFATTVTLTNGVPIESVSKMLGHKTIRTTQIYAKVLHRKLSTDMQALKLKLAGKNGINYEEVG